MDIAAKIKQDINDYCVTLYKNEHRNHLGASILGKPCARQGYYVFRWAKLPTFDGRMLRLFNRGHREEPKFIEYLRGIGFQVTETTEDGKQIRIADICGHFGGSLDGEASAPAEYGLPPRFLVEFKTYNTKRFCKLVSDGVRKADEKYYAQCCLYMSKRGLSHCLFMATNKNDDDIHIEIIEADEQQAQAELRKADVIINAEYPPQRISDKKSFFECRYCDFKEICHEGELPEKNCRSCVNAKPVANGEWLCNKWSAIIPNDVIPNGCDEWSGIR